jgi:DNA-binding NtrC family response regulator
LRNVLERAAVMCGDREIRPEDLRLPKTTEASAPVWTSASSMAASPPIPIEPASIPKPGAADARTHLKEMERQMIIEAMERNRHNKAAVARELGIPLSTLKRRLKEYRIGDEE